MGGAYAVDPRTTPRARAAGLQVTLCRAGWEGGLQLELAIGLKPTPTPGGGLRPQTRVETGVGLATGVEAQTAPWPWRPPSLPRQSLDPW